MKKSLRQDQRGLAHIALILLVVVVIAAIGFVGWQISKKNRDGTSSSNGTSTVSKKEVQDQCNSVIDDKDLCKFAAAMSADDLAYTATLSSTGSSDTTMTVKSDGKGNSQVTSNGGDFAFDSITIGKDTYTKFSSDTSWTKTTSTDSLATVPSDELKYNFTEADKNSYKKIGKEACGKLTCFKYQFVDPEATDASTSDTFVWFDTKDYRLQRMTSKLDDTTSDMSFTYGKVTISTPSPVKE